MTMAPETKNLLTRLKDKFSMSREGEKEKDVYDLDTEFSEFKGWEAMGFQRSLGKEMWEIVIELLNTILMLFVLIYLIPIIQPFPEILGYNNIAVSLFATIFIIFDTGTNFGISRFIAQHRVKDPKRMLQYVSFHMKYQMITGLIQITIMSWYTFSFLQTGSYAYLTWIILLILQKQWPGMLGIFKTTLSGLQHHAVVSAMGFLQGTFVERITLIGFILIGRWWGETTPGIGIIMGICIFTQLGNYIDDVVFGFISGWYLNKILKRYMKLSLRDVFQVKISKDVMKEMLYYGVQGSLLPILSSFVGTMTLLIYTQQIPAYVSWSALIAYGYTYSGFVNNVGDFALEASIAESYSNGKKELAEFYVSYTIRWRYFFFILVGITMFAIIPYFLYIIENFGALKYYLGSTIFFVPMLVKRLIDPILQLPSPIMTGALHITPFNIIRAVEESLKLLTLYLYIYAFRVQDNWGLVGTVFLIGFNGYVPYIIKTIMCYAYVNKKILTIKVNWRGTFLSPIIASLPVLALTQAWYYIGFLPLLEILGDIITIIISLLLALVVLIFVYFPLNVLVGGWDDYMFHVFKKAVDISGPSKPIFGMVYQLMVACKKLAIKMGRWDRPGWTIPHEKAHEQIIELMAQKRNILKEKPEGSD
jgi:hypothetical protein